MGKEHQRMMGNHISFICMACEYHLTTDRFLSGSDGHLFTLFIKYKPARFTAYILVWPQHESNDLAFESLLSQAFAQVVGQLANSGTGFVGICHMMKTHTGILA